MNIHYRAYMLLTAGLVPAFLPGFWLYSRITGRYRKDFKERLGCLPEKVLQSLTGTPRIWLHAVSLGEVKVAASIIAALGQILPEASILLSTFTEHGRNLAEATLGERVSVIYAPLDFAGFVGRSLAAVRPHAMVFLETEIWPAWVHAARRMGAKTALVNGRISQQSIGAYRKFRPLFREVLKNFDLLSMIMEGDAARIKEMGAEAKKIQIHGNAKYDLPEEMADPAAEKEMRRLLNLSSSQRVFVAGSTRQGEEESILQAYRRIEDAFPDTLLVIAPRHIERAPAIAAMTQGRGFSCQLRTDLEKGPRTAQVVILNTFGELFNAYSVSTVSFCGGSLAPMGGQNPMEPALWGKPVFYGPSMENFLDAKALLEAAGAGVEVPDSEALARKAIDLMNRPEALSACGMQGREAVLRNQGAAERHARAIKALLDHAK